MQLSISTQKWLSTYGLDISLVDLRTAIHIPEYVLVGLAVFLFGMVRNWPLWKIFLVAFFISIVEETMKYYLPERDFDLTDLAVDCVGIGISLGLYRFITKK